MEPSRLRNRNGAGIWHETFKVAAGNYEAIYQNMPVMGSLSPVADWRSEREPWGPHMYEYKVLTERDGTFSGRFDAQSLENVLNGYAKEGWRVASGFLATSVWKSSKTDIVVILERDKPSAG